MTFDLAWGFRGTAGYVTDPSYQVPAVGETYPHTYTAANGYSINAGLSAAQNILNRSATNDPRIAGINYGDNNNPGSIDFTVALGSGSAPGAGTYTVDIAMGDPGGAQHQDFKLLDTSTTLIDGTNGGSGYSTATGHFIDASLADVAATTSWTGTTASKTFATTTAILSIGIDACGGTFTVSHFRLTLAGATSYTLTAAKGTLSMSGQAAAPRADRRLTGAKGTLGMTGRTSSALAARRLTAAKGTLALTGRAALERTDRRLTGAKGTLALTGQAATRRADRRLTAAKGSFSLTAPAAVPSVARRVLAATGTLVLAGAAATITKLSGGYRFAADTGALLLTGLDASVVRAGQLAAATGVFTLTGRNATLRYTVPGTSTYRDRRDTTQPFRRHYS